MPKHEAREFGVIEVDDDGRILDFHEKVAEPPTMPGDDERCLASMGNYVFDTQTLIDVVTPRDEHVHRPRRPRDPGAHQGGRRPRLRLLDATSCPGRTSASAATGATSGRSTPTTPPTWTSSRRSRCSTSTTTAWPVYTYRGAEPPAKVSRGPGWRAGVRRRQPAVRGLDRLGRPRRALDRRPRRATSTNDAHVTDSILFPGVRVGAGARLHRCIVDKNVEVPDWYRIGLEPDKDRERFTVSDSGIAVIEKDRQL